MKTRGILVVAVGALTSPTFAAGSERFIRLSAAESLHIADEGAGAPAVVLIPGQLLRARLASFAVEEVPRVGHFAFEEDPAAVVAAVGRAAALAGPSPALASR